MATLFLIAATAAFGWGAQEQDSITGRVTRIDASPENGDTMYIRLSTPEGEVMVEIAPSDVARLGLADGDEITVSGNWYLPDSDDRPDDPPEISARIVQSDGRRFRVDDEDSEDEDADDSTDDRRNDRDSDYDDDDPDYDDDDPDDWGDADEEWDDWEDEDEDEGEPDD